MARLRWTAGVALVALGVRLPLMFQRHDVSPGDDSEGYVDLGSRLFSGGLASEQSAYRPPGYPLFLAFGDLLPGRIEDAGAVMQLLLGGALAGLIVYFAWGIFGALPAVVTGLLVALTHTSLSVEAILLSDWLFGAVVCVACALLIVATQAHGRRRLKFLIAVGVAIAAATYVKPVGHALILAPLVPLLVATRSWRATARGTAVVAGIALALTIPWMARNAVEYQAFSMSIRSGPTLFNRAFERDHLPPPTDQPAGRHLQAWMKQHPGSRPSSGFRDELRSTGLSPAEANAVQRDLALTAIRRHPFKTAKGTVTSIRTMYSEVARGSGSGPLKGQIAARRSLLPRRVTIAGLDVGERLRRAWRLLSLSGLAAVLWFVLADPRKRVAATCVVAVWLSVASATALLHGGQFRYSAALAPFVWLAGSLGVAAITQAISAALSSRFR